MNEKVKSVVALAGPSVGIGALFVNQGFRRSGWALVAIGGGIVVLGFVSAAAPPLARILLFISKPIRALVALMLKVAKQAYIWLVRILIRPALEPTESKAAEVLGWTASQQRAFFAEGQRADFLEFKGQPDEWLRGLEFSIRPDYQFAYWRAGFRLGPTAENFEAAGITSGFLFHIGCSDATEQPHMVMYYMGQAFAADLPQNANQARTPAYVVRANIWRVPHTNRARISVSVNNVTFQPEREVDSRQTERLLLLAWGDGRPFRVNFDGIRSYWSPHD